MKPSAIYLRNHEAAARAGVDLFRRVARAQRRRSYGPEIAALRQEVAEDRDALLELMRLVGVRRSTMLGLALRLGERLGRLKPNGALIRRSRLSDLIEIEGLTDAVHAKEMGWRALTSAGVGNSGELDRLQTRAKQQNRRLRRLHAQASRSALRAR